LVFRHDALRYCRVLGQQGCLPSQAQHDTGRRRIRAHAFRINFLADVHRPTKPGRYPVLIAASIYPRQVQRLGSTVNFVPSR
jgi:hypothetical protein